MTLSTITPTRSGSTPSKVQDGPRSGQSPVPHWLVEAAHAMGCQPLVAKQRAHFAFQWVRIMLAKMVAFDNSQLAEQKMAEFESVLGRDIPTITGAFRVVIASDAAEDVARQTYLLDPNDKTMSAVKRTVIQEAVAKLALLRSIEALERRHA